MEILYKMTFSMSIYILLKYKRAMEAPTAARWDNRKELPVFIATLAFMGGK
ncbi:MAG: hypothetical protein NTY16_11155 [Deltaproteobacteria bacterium]|nr:hypothetical protein [Deltaproteobacteria bacterium]